MEKIPSNFTYIRALLEGLIVTFLWSTSYVLVKIGLNDIPPLTFAAYRYIIASVVLLTVLSINSRRKVSLRKKDLVKLFLLGISGYTIAQGLQFVGLKLLPAITVTFLLNFTPLIVLFFTIVFLKEFPSTFQIVGTTLAMFGAYLYFQAPLSSADLIGITVILLSGVGWAAYMIMSREFLKEDRFNLLSLTGLSMFFGAIPLLFSAFLIEGFQEFSFSCLLIILWLSLVNTASAFIIWNHALIKIGAFKLSILQNTMLIQIAILAWAFIGEELVSIRILALIIVFLGVLIVQKTKSRS